jgi:hypothetical protein
VTITLRGGWKPTPPEQPRVRLTPALRGAVGPTSIDRGKALPVVGMHLNDRWGCCTAAASANVIQQQTFYGGHTEAVIPDSAVLREYEVIGGFNPNAGGPGANPTDNGATVPSALAYLKKTGLTGHRIAAYGEVDVTEIAKIKTAIWEFGGVVIGLNLPNSAMRQFNAGQDWFVDPADMSIDGGHAVYVCGYNANGFMLWTWDALWYMDIGFWHSFVEEAWAPVSQYWVDSLTRTDPDGVSLVTLGAEFLAITGQNPFPPSPVPAPTSAPAPDLASAPAAPKRSSLKKALRRLRYGS